MDSKMAQK